MPQGWAYEEDPVTRRSVLIVFDETHYRITHDCPSPLWRHADLPPCLMPNRIDEVSFPVGVPRTMATLAKLLLMRRRNMIDFTRATELTPEVAAAIDDAFEYHKWDEAQIAAGARVRTALAEAVKTIVRDVPPGPDRTVAIRKIREARMDANSAITHGGKY